MMDKPSCPFGLQNTKKGKYCFEIRMTDRPPCLMAAENEAELMDWISTLNKVINSADTTSQLSRDSSKGGRHSRLVFVCEVCKCSCHLFLLLCLLLQLFVSSSSFSLFFIFFLLLLLFLHFFFFFFYCLFPPFLSILLLLLFHCLSSGFDRGLDFENKGMRKPKFLQ